MDEIRRQRAALQAAWDALSGWQKAAAAPQVVPMLEKLDALIELLEEHSHGHQT